MSGEQIKFYYYNAQSLFKANLSSIPESAIVFVGDEDDPAIWTHGVEFKGGAKKEPEPVIPTYNMSKIYKRIFTNRSEATATVSSSSISEYLPISDNTTSTTTQWSITLNNQYLHIAIPSGYSITSIRTSNNETLTLADDFTSQVISGLGTIYKYVPVYPADYTITFNFSIPQNT